MSKLLIGLRNRARPWLTKDSFDWLTGCLAPADVLTEIPTRNNELSVWQVDDEEVEQITRVVLALACSRDTFQDYYYVIFDGGRLTTIGVTAEPTIGKTAIPIINPLHRDLTNLTTRQLSEIAQIVFSEDVLWLTQKQVESGINDRYGSEIMPELMNSKLRIKVESMRG